MNLQQVPSHEKSIRMMFTAKDMYNHILLENNYYKVNLYDEILLSNNNWIEVCNLKCGDCILIEDNTVEYIKNIVYDKNDVYIYI